MAQAARQDVERAIPSVLQVLARRARYVLGDASIREIRRAVLAEGTPDTALWDALQRWAQADSRPLVLLIDEIDALEGDTLLSVLRQLCSAYQDRPAGFPHSIVLCGVRDVQDYRIHSPTAGQPVAGGSPFSISAASLHMGDFDRGEVEALLGQHTDETGQHFEPAAVERVYAHRPLASHGW